MARSYRSERIGNFLLGLIIVLISLTCLFPLINQIAVSFSSQAAISANRVTVWPIGFHTRAYKSILRNMSSYRSLAVTVYVTIVGTTINLLLTVLTADPLTKGYLKHRPAIMSFIVFTMLFSGGMIPTYLLVDGICLNNTPWALILPTALSTFNLIILKTFFQTIPSDLEDCAIVDGCGHARILLSIYLPLSGVVLATLGEFYAVFHWNSYMDAIIDISDVNKYTLQVRLRQLLIFPDPNEMTSGLNEAGQSIVVLESLKAAVVIVSTLPILLVYPWLQKYFVKGVMIGAIKG